MNVLQGKHVMLPELGEGISKATVAFWHFREGDRVNAEDDIVELVTDKATFNVSSGFPGTLRQILVPVGQEANIGQPLAVIEPLSIQP